MTPKQKTEMWLMALTIAALRGWEWEELTYNEKAVLLLLSRRMCILIEEEMNK